MYMSDHFKINFYSLRKKNLIPYFKSTQNISVLRGWWGILSFFTVTNDSVQFFICKLDLSNCSSFRRQHGRVVNTSDLQCCGLGFVESCAGQATNWICSWLLRVEILSHACKLPAGCLLAVGVFSPVMLYVDYLFQILLSFFIISFKTFLHFCLAQVSHLILYNQLPLTKSRRQLLISV